MGGIVGILSPRTTISGEGQRVAQQMIDVINHRAPISTACSFNDGCAFGVRFHTRIEQARVFAHDESKSLYVAIDGELFTGFKGSSANETFSDAELILNIYREKGLGFLDEIDGSFSIAIWDGMEKRLLLARDRLGFKPLFYTKANQTFIFASELKSILASGLSEKSDSLRALNDFLSYGYVCNPETMFESIFQVKPGHFLIFKDGEISEKPYWKFNYRQDGK